MSRINTEWLRTKKIFLNLHPPNHQGYWICNHCGKWTEDIEVDHIIPRSNRPDLRNTLSNLQLLCGVCNSKKGSKH